jgi:hypothetical protein
MDSNQNMIINSDPNLIPLKNTDSVMNTGAILIIHPDPFTKSDIITNQDPIENSDTVENSDHGTN